MEKGTLIIAAAGAVGLGVVLYQRWKAGQPTGQASPCAAVGAVAGRYAAATHPEEPQAGEVAKQAATLGCQAWSKLPADKKIISAIAGVPGLSFAYAWDGVRWATSRLIGGRDTAEERRRNIALNGPVVAAADPRIPVAFVQRRSPGVYTPRVRGADGALGLEIPLRHANGCVPYSGHADASKCAPGTFPQDRGANRYTAAMGTGRADDPVSGRHVEALGRFPLAVPAGAVGYWDRGAAKVCAGGLTEDHRATGGGITCGAAYTRPTSGAGSVTVGGVLVVPDTRGDVPPRQAP